MSDNKTKKLYYYDSHISEFEARITDIRKCADHFVIILDQTAFFATGGGQQNDTGFIENMPVFNVEENNNEIQHFVNGDCLFLTGDIVRCKIDYEKRFARMQAHSGEHIISGIAHSLYNVENVGFHMDDCLMTIDFDKYLTKEQLSIVEEKANKCIYENLPVISSVYNDEDAVNIDYRSKKEISGELRLVEIKGVDICACCAPHVSNTGEIGSIKILSSVSHRGGVRITAVCGINAYYDYKIKYDQCLMVAADLAVKHNDIYDGVTQLSNKIDSLKYEISTYRTRLCKYISDSITLSNDTTTAFFRDLSVDEMCLIAAEKVKDHNGLLVMCSGNDDDGYAYVIIKKDYALNKCAKTINSALNGRGGGRDEMIRGNFKCAKAEIEKYFESFEVM